MKLQSKIFVILFVICFIITATTGILHEPLIEAGIYNYIHVPFAYLMALLGFMHIIKFRRIIFNVFKK